MLSFAHCMMKKFSIDLQKETTIQYLAGFFCLFIYAGSLFFPLYDKDAAHHANIALYMYEHNDLTSLVDRGKDYLDKPHFLFWTSYLFFELFGVNTFSHRLPHILFALISVYSVFKLTRHLADKTTAKIAAIMLATALGFVLSVTDARMETPLTAGIIFGLWQLVLYLDKQQFINLLLAALATAIAFSTKGWLGPVVMFIAAFFYILLNRRWYVFAQVKTWMFVPVFFILISPVLYAYYVQFDQHPEKVIRGEDGRSGIKFILWDQLFERAKGFDVKERHGGYFFLYHTFLWSFFPWSIFAYAAVVFWFRRMFIQKKWRHTFHFAALAFAFILFAISFSKFKMPHYTVMLLPLAALFTAPFLRYVLSTGKGLRIFYPLQLGFGIVVLVAMILLNFYFFQADNILVWISGIPLLMAFLFLLIKRFSNKALKTFYVSVSLSIVATFFLNYNIFPFLTKYQGSHILAERIKKGEQNIPNNRIVVLEQHAHAFDFYLGKNHRVVEGPDFADTYPEISDSYFLLTPFQGRYLEERGFSIEPLMMQHDYNIATVKFDFLNPKTRHKVLDTLMIARIYEKR